MIGSLLRVVEAECARCMEHLPHFSLARDSLSVRTLVPTPQQNPDRKDPRSNHVRRASLMCLLISNAPGLDDISHMSALVIDLSVITHRE